MTAEVDICNLALTRLGHSQISALDEGTKASDLCTLHYPIARDAVLRAHPWNFAIARANLALSGTTPNHEYSYQHALPSGPSPAYCLKVLRTSWEASGFSGAAVYGFAGLVGGYEWPLPYRIEGRYLLSNETAVSIEYIGRVTDPNQFDALFTDLLAQRLAGEVALPLTDTASVAKQMWDIYAAKLAEARSSDAQEGTPRAVVDLSPWLIARQ